MKRICENCGAEVKDTIFCPECGKYLPRNKSGNSYAKFLIPVALIIIILLAGYIYFDDNSKVETSLSMISNSSSDTYTVKLTDSNNQPLADKLVIVNVNDSNYTLKTDADGKADINLTLSQGTYTVDSSFNGDIDYKNSHTSDIIIKSGNSQSLN